MDVITLLDQLDDLIYQSKPVPFRDQARVDREEAYALLDQIRVALPEEIKQAEWIVRERHELQREEPGNGGLRAVADSIDELRRSRRPTPPPLTPAAAEKVCSIIEAAEEVRAEAEREAREIDEEARRRAQEISVQADARLRRADDLIKTLLTEAGAASAEIDGLLERVRGPAAALADVLGDRAVKLETEFGRMRAAVEEAKPEADPAPVEEPRPPEASEPLAQPTEEWDYAGAIEGDEPPAVEADPSLPGAESYVHAERIEAEEGTPTRAGPRRSLGS